MRYLKALADGLSIDEIWSSIQEPTAEVVEDYPTDPRGPSCLVLSFVQGRPSTPALRILPSVMLPGGGYNLLHL